MKLRVDPFVVGDFLHVFNRGNRGMILFPELGDKWRFLKILRYFNDRRSSAHIFQKLTRETGFDPAHPFKFEWRGNSSKPKPVVKILAYSLKDNHFHLLLKEIVKGGISFFMKKLSNGFTAFINLKYGEKGRIFQGSYRGRRIPNENLLQYLDAYIQVFNSFEEYPGGIERALKEFNKAFEFVLNNPFSSLGESFGKRKLEIVERDVLGEMFPDLKIYKEFAYDALLVRNVREILGKLTLE
jgi:hypothetical protein